MPDKHDKKCVTIISGNLAGGGVLACAGLGRALQSHYSVQLIGSLFGAAPWSGLQDLDYEVDILPGGQFPAYTRTIKKILGRIKGDIVIAHQLRLPSFGIGLMNRVRKRIPCALYIDDDDLALTRPGRSNRLRDRLRTPNGDLYTRLVYRYRQRADAIFCGSEYFSSRFAGITVPFGRDASLYDPQDFDREALREKLGFGPSQTIVGFIGNPRPHVGFEDLVAALEIINDEHCRLLVVPVGKASDFANDLFRKMSVPVQVLEDRLNSDIPSLLSVSDIVVVPQRSGDVSLGQLPARLVEGMAMAKPIVTTKIADIPDLLGDAGIYVPDRDPSAIAAAIQHIRDHPDEAASMGKRARRIFLKKLSLEAMAEKLLPELDMLLKRAPGKRI